MIYIYYLKNIEAETFYPDIRYRVSGSVGLENDVDAYWPRKVSLSSVFKQMCVVWEEHHQAKHVPS